MKTIQTIGYSAAPFIITILMMGCATPHERLSKALDRGDADTVRTILKSDLTSGNAADILFARARIGDTRSVQILLDAGVPMDAGKSTALIAAAANGKLETVTLLLKRGAPIDFQEEALGRVIS